MKDYLEKPELLSSRPVSRSKLSLREMARDYNPDSRLREAINDAIDFGKPLLISGGSSDSEIAVPAYYAAYKIESELFHFRTRHDSTAKDLLYRFDSVAYMHDAQMAMREELEKNRYLQKGILWQAVDQGLAAEKPMVLLVDALDRAPDGFLEDLLLELDLLSFTVSETAKIVEFRQEYSPVVFLAASNLEKIAPYIRNQCINYILPKIIEKEASSKESDTHSMVFISYAHEDSEGANRLYADLKQKGINVWLDSENLLPGQNWQVAIKKAIRYCTYFVALLSSNSVSKKGFVQKELKLALDVLDEVPSEDVFIVPVRITNCDPNDQRLKTLHWADLFPDYEKGLGKLLRVLATKNRGQQTQQ